MDFFGHQDRARRQSGRLVVGFLIALLVIVAAIDAAAVGITALAAGHEPRTAGDVVPVVLIVTLVTLLVVGLGSLYKTKSLARGGGAAVARMMGARPVLDTSTSAADRRLKNVVEEMAIASGLPVPQVFVMEDQSGINAFAAGIQPGDAVVGVTRGAVDRLDRDELQGVIAHEFSHILNGDMHLNLRLVGLLFGILLMATAGRILIYSLRHVRVRGKASGVIGVLFLAGIALFVLGSIGYLAGRILKAAVNRQREYLADASAVQFTRNPVGLSGALQKIKGRGSRVKHVRTSEISHLFFGNALKGSFFGMLATHPKVESRLDRIEPGWRDRPVRETESRRRPREEAAGRARGAGLASPLPETFSLMAGEVASLVGRLDLTSPETGEAAIAVLPDRIRDAASEPFSARAVALAAIVDARPEALAQALDALRAEGDDKLAAEVARLHPHITALGDGETLSTVLLAIPALREMSDPQRRAFVKVLHAVVASDGVITLQEHALAELIALHLGLVPEPRAGLVAYDIRAATLDLLAVLARSEAEDEAQAQRAFELGRKHLQVEGPLPEAAADPYRTLHDALRTCRAAPPVVKRRVVTAASWTVSEDGVLSPTEAALLRLVVDALECPLPRIDPTRTPHAPEQPPS